MRKSARRIAADGGRFSCRHKRTRSERRNSIPDRDAFPLTANSKQQTDQVICAWVLMPAPAAEQHVY